MGQSTDWTREDAIMSIKDSPPLVDRLMNERRYGYFLIKEVQFRSLCQYGVVGLFANYIPIEMRMATYESEEEDVRVIECLGLSQGFKSLTEDEKTPFYDIEVLEEGNGNL